MKAAKRESATGAEGTPPQEQTRTVPAPAPRIAPDPKLPQPATWEPRYNDRGTPPAYDADADEG